MAERYKRLYALPENLYTSGSPILIQAGALLKDTQTGKILTQLKLKNLFHSTLVACKVSIRAFAPGGEEIKGVENYSYLDLNVVRGQSFGAQVPIYLPDDTTRKVSAFVTEAVYEDGGVWRQEKGEWRSVPQQETLADKFAEAELRKQYEIEVGGNCDFVPETVGGLFLCACGAINLAADKTCWSCGRNASDLVDALDLKTLMPKRDVRLEQEEQKRIQKAREMEKWRLGMEKQRLEQEHREEERRIAFRKKLKLGIGVAVLCAGFLLLMTKVIIPNKKYNDAVVLQQAGNYQEALGIFEGIGDYKDSAEKVLLCIYKLAELGNYDPEEYYRYYEIKKIDFDDGELHSLEGLLKSVSKISNKTLREDLEKIPQVKICMKLEGVWAWYGVDEVLKKIVIRDGKVTEIFPGPGIEIEESLSYYKGQYYFAVGEKANDNDKIDIVSENMLVQYLSNGHPIEYRK